MLDFVNSAVSDLANPRQFLAAARRDLARGIPAGWELFRARLRGQARQSWLGRAALLVPTVGVVLLCAFIQRRAILTIGSTGMPYSAFVLAGFTGWQIFVDAVQAPLRSLDASRPLIAFSDLPNEAVLLAALLDTALNALIRLIVAGVAMALLWGFAGPLLLFAPLAAAALLVAGFAIGVATAPAAMLFHDLRQAIGIGLTLLLFLTPVFYPLASDGWLALNPVRPLIETLRAALTGGALPAAFPAVAAGAPLLLLAAWIFYRIARPFFVERMGN